MKARARFLGKHHQDIRYQALIDFYQLPLLVRIAPVEILLKLRSICGGGSGNLNGLVAVHIQDAPVTVAQFDQSELLCGIPQILHELDRFAVVLRAVPDIHDFLVGRAYASQPVHVVVSPQIIGNPLLGCRLIV